MTASRDCICGLLWYDIGTVNNDRSTFTFPRGESCDAIGF
jgi:hypothetical protein